MAASMRHDPAPQRFRESHPEDRFEGTSQVFFEQAMAQTRMAICLTDPHQPDNPIVFANRAFRALTGYSHDEIIGRNCRFLQGPDTSPETVQHLARAIANEEVTVVELLNYRRDGSGFWNALHIGPIYDADGKLVYFFGSQWDVSEVRAARNEGQHAKRMARELSHRMKNMFAVIGGIVNVTGRANGIEKEAAEINSRIQALARAYETTLDDAAIGTVDVEEAIQSILKPYLDDGHRLAFDSRSGTARVSFATVSLLGLVLHEFAVDAVKYGAWSAESGVVALHWNADPHCNRLHLEWQEDGGPEVDENAITAGTGAALVDRMLRTGSGQIERRWHRGGLHALVELPI